MSITILDDSKRIPGVLKEIDKYKYNPAGIQRIILQHLKDVTEGKVEIVDPTNPFVFALESSAVNTAAFMIENAANTRKQYPALAQTAEDLYMHMSDKDFIDRFATPAITTFSMMIQKDDLLQKMVYDPETLGKKITIPRNSEFTIADITFSLQYPIDIKQLVHGGIQVVYDTDNTTPLQELDTNVIDWEIRTDQNKIEWLYFEFIVYQFKINSITTSLSSTTGFNQTIVMKDEFYYAKVYYKNNSSGSWVEITTTHTDQVYDPITPTAVLKVIDKQVTVYIPQIYLNTGLITGTIRVDIYETKGNINIALENYAVGAFSSKWLNLDKAYNTTFTAAISTIAAFAYSTKSINSGTPALTFNQLRTQIISNAIGDRSLPITNVQIQSSLEKQGYSVVKDIDVVTNRVFLATKLLPKPLNDKLITAAASSIETLIISMNEAVTHEGVVNNGNRITLTPDVIYQNNNGVIKIFPKQQLDSLLVTSPDNIAFNVSNNNYLYTPFHYVLDTTGAEFEVRPYFLNKPVAQTVRFISQNDSTTLQINTKIYNTIRTSSGYKLNIVTKSNKAIQDLDDSSLFVQLSFIPIGEDTRAHLNGILVGRNSDNERIFEFDLSTNFDIDINDNLFLSKFLMFTNDPKLLKTSLNNEFDIVYSTNIPMPNTWVSSAIDSLVGKFLLPDSIIAITQEKLKIRFGYSLKTLWARSRSVVSDAPFQKYTTNVPWLYEKDVYEVDLETGSSFSFDINNEIVYKIIHPAGTPILDADGNVTYRYRIGDIKLGSDGNPLLAAPSTVNRQIDIMFIEGAYFFATDIAAAEYRDNIIDTVVNWLTIDLANLGKNLLEQTRLYFYPKTTMGGIRVMIDNGVITTIEGGQYFEVQLYVSNSVFQNTGLREALKRTTISTIDNSLKETTISISDITTSLKEAYGNDVISLNVKGLGGSKNVSMITVMDEGDRCNIRKRLVKLPDEKLIVAEDVTINFIKHSL